ncbi:deleted in malignant brain tumors 1 protein-like [Mercenaria mercenaria]|uniref:deleted in malignant brain tumors 1 protein-like n=1 Tax=Mercenaria mercenaria TaxID=6596 RepID=UPI00234EEE25|nr:deleted in malignant brain tumors 1 protein-like [Mercenaria mercenaria]
MNTLSILLKLGLLVLSHNKIALAVVGSNKYQRYVENGKLPFSFAMLLDKSLSECAADCSQKTGKCMAVNYNPVIEQCELIEHHQSVVGDLVTVHDGWNVYYIDNPALSPCVPSFTYVTYVASESKNVITSPNYPSNYNTGDDIYWLIIKPSKTSRLVVNVHDMVLEDQGHCYDSLSFYNGTCTSDVLITKMCGTGIPSFEDVISLYVLVHFYSDCCTTDTGFSLEYFIA